MLPSCTTNPGRSSFSFVLASTSNGRASVQWTKGLQILLQGYFQEYISIFPKTAVHFPIKYLASVILTQSRSDFCSWSSLSQHPSCSIAGVGGETGCAFNSRQHSLHPHFSTFSGQSQACGFVTSCVSVTPKLLHLRLSAEAQTQLVKALTDISDGNHGKSDLPMCPIIRHFLPPPTWSHL